MLITKQNAIEDFKKILGERVSTDEQSLKAGDGYNRNFAKAFGIYSAPLPFCILNAASKEEISELLKYCNKNRISVIPRTGASSFEALLEPINEETVILDGSLMNKVLLLDEENMMVTAQCGTPFQVIEDLARKKGLTTGHGPQSLPMADIGGLVATRSIGQFSTYYGGIEDMVCGLEAVLPNGEIIRIRNVPRRAFGPDLRQLFIGCEGALAYLTEITVKLFPFYPDDMWMGGYMMKDMHQGIKAIRDIITAGYKPSVVRLYDKPDMDENFHSIQMEGEEAFMFFVTEGPPALSKATGEAIHRMAVERGGKAVGSAAVEHWMEHRNDLCKKISDPKAAEKSRETKVLYATTEISASWTDIAKIYDDVMKNIPLKFDNIIMLGGHISHSYINGTNIYFVYKLKLDNPETSNEEQTAFVHALCEEVLKYETGGCVHHHGAGKQRVDFSKKEHGTSYPLMVSLKKMFDPNAIMNPGDLILKADL